jgi:hypothetical protein
MKLKMRTSVVALNSVLASLMLAACGSSDEPLVQGKFVGGPVAGLTYNTSTGINGATDINGTFDYRGGTSGDAVSFKLGSITLGTIAGASLVTPLDLVTGAAVSDARVINRLQLLQSLDSDKDVDNGTVVDPIMVAKLNSTINPDETDGTKFEAALKTALGNTPVNRNLARESFESNLAAIGRSVTTIKEAISGGSVTVSKHRVSVPTSMFVPYEGSSVELKAAFPKGFPLAVGSGMAVKSVNSDGSIDFYVLTDRGSNADGPNIMVGTSAYGTKVFPAPSFVPTFGVMRLANGVATMQSITPMINEKGAKLTGLPLPIGTPGSSSEVALNESLQALNGDPLGLDPEGIVFDKANGKLYISDEYGPFIVKVDVATGKIEDRFAPAMAGSTASKPVLPAVLNLRRANRGMEGLAMDAAGELHGIIQSPLDAKVTVDDGSSVSVSKTALFVRWLVLNPSTGTTKTYAYPLSKTDWSKSDTGQAKMGDVAYVAPGKFLVIEQGLNASSVLVNKIMLVEIPSDATNINALGAELEASSSTAKSVLGVDWTKVVPLKRTLLLQLNEAGWMAEKAEGLTVINGDTIALINDNDFGVTPALFDANGVAISGDVTACLTENGKLANNGTKVCPASAIRVAPGSDVERPTRLYTFKFPKAISSYSLK